MAKLDLSGVKSFFFEKGEKVGMVACVAAAVGLIGYGLMGGLGAGGEGYSKTIETAVAEVRNKLVVGIPVEPVKSEDTPRAEWKPLPPSFQQLNLFQMQDHFKDGRLNPRAFGIRNDPEKKQIQMNYIAGTYQAYDINHRARLATVIKEPKANMPLPKAGPNRPPVAFGPGGVGAGQMPVITIQPARMVVVDAVFPLSEQLEEFRKAFRMGHQSELWGAGTRDLPRFLGLNVYKLEFAPGAKDPTITALLQYNYKTEKLEVDAALQQMLREAIPDDQLTGAPFVFQGLVMMQPKLSSPMSALLPDGISFPKAELEGIDWENLVAGGAAGVVGPNQPRPMFPRPGAQGGMRQGPAMAGGAAGGPDVELDPKMPWAKLSPDLQEKFTDKFNVLDPSGILIDPEEGKPQVAGQVPLPAPPIRVQNLGGQGQSPYLPPSPYAAMSQWGQYPIPEPPPGFVPAGNNPMQIPFRPNLQRGVPQAPGGAALKPYEALVRFIDVGVKPGYTYKYQVQVRIGNPNFGLKGQVAFAKLAEFTELPPAPYVETPAITIPDEYFLYAVDQKPSNPKLANGSDDKAAKNDQVAVQIHRWVERTTDPSTGAESVIGDWAIAERLLLRRGDPIGRVINVEIPIWNKKTGQYELSLAMVAANAAPAPAAAQKKPGFFDPNIGKPLPPGKKPASAELGDVGGVPISFAESTPPAILADFDGGSRKVGTATDESAAQLLILGADGKLTVRNTRVDSDPDSAETKIRIQRIEDWKAKVGQYRTDATGTNPTPGQPNPFLQGPNIRKN